MAHENKRCSKPLRKRDMVTFKARPQTHEKGHGFLTRKAVGRSVLERRAPSGTTHKPGRLHPGSLRWTPDSRIMGSEHVSHAWEA